MNSLEILAAIVISLSVIKIIFGFTNPKAWLTFSKKVYVKPSLTSLIALILAAIVLQTLLNAGITIIDILAVTVFIMLVMIVGLARYFTKIIAWAEGQDMKAMMKEVWLHTLVWLLLLGWGVKELLF